MSNDDELNELESKTGCAETTLGRLGGDLPLISGSWDEFLESAFQQADDSEKTVIAVAYLLGRNQQKPGEVNRAKGRPKGSTKFGIPADFARYLAYLALSGILAEEEEGGPAGLTRTSDKISYLRDLEADGWNDPTMGLLAELLLDPMIEQESLLSSIRAGRAAYKRRIKAG